MRKVGAHTHRAQSTAMSAYRISTQRFAQCWSLLCRMNKYFCFFLSMVSTMYGSYYYVFLLSITIYCWLFRFVGCWENNEQDDGSGGRPKTEVIIIKLFDKQMNDLNKAQMKFHGKRNGLRLLWLKCTAKRETHRARAGIKFARGDDWSTSRNSCAHTHAYSSTAFSMGK